MAHAVPGVGHYSATATFYMYIFTYMFTLYGARSPRSGALRAPAARGRWFRLLMEQAAKGPVLY